MRNSHVLLGQEEVPISDELRQALRESRKPNTMFREFMYRVASFGTGFSTAAATIYTSGSSSIFTLGAAFLVGAGAVEVGTYMYDNYRRQHMIDKVISKEARETKKSISDDKDIKIVTLDLKDFSYVRKSEYTNKVTATKVFNSDCEAYLVFNSNYTDLSRMHDPLNKTYALGLVSGKTDVELSCSIGKDTYVLDQMRLDTNDAESVKKLDALIQSYKKMDYEKLQERVNSLKQNSGIELTFGLEDNMSSFKDNDKVILRKSRGDEKIEIHFKDANMNLETVYEKTKEGSRVAGEKVTIPAYQGTMEIYCQKGVSNENKLVSTIEMGTNTSIEQLKEAFVAFREFDFKGLTAKDKEFSQKRMQIRTNELSNTKTTMER